jgi:hypothetical protein
MGMFMSKLNMGKKITERVLDTRCFRYPPVGPEHTVY